MKQLQGSFFSREDKDPRFRLTTLSFKCLLAILKEFISQKLFVVVKQHCEGKGKNLLKCCYINNQMYFCWYGKSQKAIFQNLIFFNYNCIFIFNLNLGGLFWGSFWGVCVAGGSKIIPSYLKLIRIMRETSNFTRMYISICSFRKYTF